MAEQRREETPTECANCGASIPPGARACPECGADERTGWRETEATRYDGLELPDEAWTDETGDTERRRSRGGRRHVNGVAWYWWAAGVALVVLLAFAALALR